MPLIIRAKFMTAHHTPLHATLFFYITGKGVCANLLLLQVCELSLPLQAAV